MNSTDDDDVLSCIRNGYLWKVCLIGPLCVLGIVGNSLSLIMFRRMEGSMAATMLLLLKALGCADMGNLIMYLLIHVFPSFMSLLGESARIQAPLMYSFAYVWPFAIIAMTLGTWYTVLISVHRYIAVCHPLKAPLYSSFSRVRRHVVLVTLVTVALDIPRFFQLEVVDMAVEREDGNGNATVKSFLFTDMYTSDIYQLLYLNIISVTYKKALPFIIITVFSIRLMIAVRQAQTARMKLHAVNQIPSV